MGGMNKAGGDVSILSFVVMFEFDPSRGFRNARHISVASLCGGLPGWVSGLPKRGRGGVGMEKGRKEDVTLVFLPPPRPFPPQETSTVGPTDLHFLRLRRGRVINGSTANSPLLPPCSFLLFQLSI